MARRTCDKIIGILGNIGNGNLGDEATFSAVMGNIRHFCPDAKVYGLSDNPADSRERHGIPVYPMRVANQSSERGKKADAGADARRIKEVSGANYEAAKSRLKAFPRVYSLLRLGIYVLFSFLTLAREFKFIVESVKIVKGTKILIVPGSGHLSDHFGGPLNYPYTLLKWSLIARMAGARMAFLSVGMGPLKSSLSKLLVRGALFFASYRSFRDEESRELTENIGIKSKDSVIPDLAYSLCLQNERRDTSRNEAAPTVGLNVFPHFDNRYWPVSDPEKYRQYVEKMSSFAAWLIKNGYRVVFFPTQIRADPFVIKDVKSALLEKIDKVQRGQVGEASVATHKDLMYCLSRVDTVVATRLHGIIFSFLVGKPVLAIANHHKMKAVMRGMGQSEYVIDINRMRLEDQVTKFLSLISKRDQITAEIAKKSAEYRVLLERQYRHILALL